MDIGTLLSVTQSLFAALQCTQLKDAWSIWGYKSHLDELCSIVATVKKVLLDAEAKYEELSQETMLYIEELRDALYDADDLLDEFVTLAEQKMLMEDDKFVKKVRLFFSRYNQLGVAYNMSHGVKKIVKKLDGIANKHSKFGLNLDYKPIRRMREQTCSYANTEIIGRGEDVENIVGILLNSHVQRDVSFLSIVGMGGLGKTALAQLVYNHENIAKEFPLRLWACVSDHDQSKLDVKTILAQIVESATGQKDAGNSMEVVVKRLREVLAQRRFLIVLDDLWTESRDEWLNLAGYLVGGKEGSQVVVTTRSNETAKVVVNGFTYELKGLSDENSWLLFQQMAFEQVLDQASINCYTDFINIGKDIVKICANVPLALRVIGRLLYKQEIDKWLSVKKLGLANQNGIKPILKLSYHNLESPLKSCFSYCCLYPKDFEIEKETLINLWIAQGYVVPLTGQSIDDASEEYFSILLRRCFFQDVSKDEFGEIISFKLHDLMHDVALEVTQKEICPTSSFTGDLDKMVRHVSRMTKQYGCDSFTKAHIRTYLHIHERGQCAEVPIVSILANYRCLRTLDLSGLSIKILPASIGKLIHLRYLDLSYNHYLEVIPESITKLYNLQTLILDECWRLKDLPKDLSKLVNLRVLGLFNCSGLTCMPPGMSKLVNLRVLGLRGCEGLTCMPPGMSKLTDLHTLTLYVMGKQSSSLKQYADLEGLKALNKLRGSTEIKIHFPKNGAFVKEKLPREGGYMMDKERLNGIHIRCFHERSNDVVTDYEEELLGSLQPHANLKELSLEGYKGARMPRWAIEDNLATYLPNLVQLNLGLCTELRCLPSLGKLQHLKTLGLHHLPNLEYIESHPTTFSLPSSSSEGLRFLPSLEKLTLYDLPKLKEWWGSSGGDNSSSSNKKEPHQPSLFLSQLLCLSISECPNLTSLPDCSNVEDLGLRGINEGLRIISNPTNCPKLRTLNIGNLAWLQSSLTIESYQSLNTLHLEDKDIESLTEIGVVLRACSSSLLCLIISNSPKLKSLSGGLRYLAALERLCLERLTLNELHIVSLGGEEKGGEVEGDGCPWGSLSHTLRRLDITFCKELQTLPKWMRKLTSLQQLSVWDCSKELDERCQNPNGEDWPNIQHIPRIL